MDNSIPTFNDHLAVDKSTVVNRENFQEFIELSGLELASEEADYYIVRGPTESIQEFSAYWNSEE
jgi:hypothetical protein